MKLSFIIPAYNEEKFVGKCLASILEEAKKSPSRDIEIIVVNNASKDRTKEVALGYPGVRVVDEMKKGITKARQAGFAASTGDLIANIDADTMLTPGWIEKVFTTFEKKPKFVGLTGPFIYYDLSRSWQAGVRIFYYVVYINYIVNQYILRWGSFLQGGNFIIRRDALEKIGGFNTALDFYAEDAEIAQRLYTVGNIRFDLAFPIYSSGRRVASEGALTMATRYMTNYVWMLFFKKPFTKTSTDIRPEATSQLNYKPKSWVREALIAGGAFALIGSILIVGIVAYRAFIKNATGMVFLAHAQSTIEQRLEVWSRTLTTR
jgi:glycosyltransferase involved in cell wall biosynthesis